MYSIVYTIIDSEDLYYFSELMISLESILLRMPKQKVLIVTDNATVNHVKRNEALYRDITECAEFVVVEIADGYTQKERSRFLKTTLREHICGDYLFLDTDTLICEKLPQIISDADIAMTFDLNCKISERLNMDRIGVHALNELCGTTLGDIEDYYNTGVIWVKDSSGARKFYSEWHKLWKESLQRGFLFDQPAANKAIRECGVEVETLDSTWNCQVSTNPFPLNVISQSKIIHYFNVADSPYIMCRNDMRAHSYKSAEIQRIINNPRSMFCKVVVFPLEGYEELYSSRLLKLLYLIFKEKRNLFMFGEKILRSLNNIRKRFKADR